MSAAGSSSREDKSGQPSPEDCGWVRVTDVNVAQNTGLAVFPRSGTCSVTQCAAPTTAAIRRAASRTSPAHWQLYCDDHAHERGVDIVDEHLDWADGFPLTSGGVVWPR